MELDLLEILTLTGESAGGQAHWSRSAARPRYSLSKEEFDERRSTHRFTCFDVVERILCDHDVLFAGRSNGSIVLWRLVQRNQFGGAKKNDRKEEALVTSTPHRGVVNCLTHTHLGTYGSIGGPLLFSGGADHTIKVWDAWTETLTKECCLQTLAQHDRGITALAFSTDASLLSASRDGTVRVWRPQGGRKLLRYPFFCSVKILRATTEGVIGGPAPALGASNSARTVHVWPTAATVTGGDEWALYVGDSDGTVSVYQRERVPGAGIQCGTSALRVNQISDSEVTVRRQWLHLHRLAINAFQIVPEHNFLITISNDGTCKILDYLQGNVFMTIEADWGGRQQLFTGAAWDLAYEQLVIGDASGVVQVWNTYSETRLLRERVANAMPPTGPRRGPSVPALLGFHSSKAAQVLYGLSPSQDCVFCWRTVKVQGYKKLGSHADAVTGLGFQHTRPPPPPKPVLCSEQTCPKLSVATTTPALGSTAVSSGNGSGEPAGGRGARKCAGKEAGEEGGGRGVGGMESSLVVLSASLDGTVRAWEPLGTCERYHMKQPEGEITSMEVLPEGVVLATGSECGSVRFWRLETGAGESFHVHKNTVSALASCRDRKGSLFFASGCYQGEIVLWAAYAKDGLHNSRVPKVDYTLRHVHGCEVGQDTEVLCLAFVQGGDVPLLVSGGNDCTVRCWDFNRRCALTVLEGHKDSVERLVVDGFFVFSGGCEGLVMVWNLAPLGIVGEGGWNHRQQMVAVAPAIIPAHPGGIADMVLSQGTAGLLVTCAKSEATVRVWDYTAVGKDGKCGRLVQEASFGDFHLTCLACRDGTNGQPHLFAGTAEGVIIHLALAGRGGGESEEEAQ
ncbi:unnamed protein product, partial [Discosporangium mesarthrocarpum]